MNNKIQAIIILFFSFTIQAHSQSVFKNEETTIFKDGTVFFEKTGLFYPQNGEIRISKLPFEIKPENIDRYNNTSINSERVILGSVWFSCPNNKISEIKFFDDSLKTERDYYDTKQLFEYNYKKFVKLNTYNSDTIQSGFIERVFSNRTGNNEIGYLLLQNNNSFTQIEISQISRIQFTTAPDVAKEVINRERIAILKLNSNTVKQIVNVKYLQKGITWLPNYFIELFDEKNGKVTLEASIMNDIEDIENSNLNLAVGIPVFTFSYVTSPLASNGKIVDMLALITNPPEESSSQLGGRDLTSQRPTYRESTYSTNYSAKSEGIGGEDLFFYKCENISIPKGGRSMVKIFEFEFEFEDVFTVSLKPNADLYQRNSSSSETWENSVWHSIRFANNHTLPLTTGTAFFYKKDRQKLQLVSQNQLNYTPEHELTTVKMSIAPDIWVENKDKEIKREEINYNKLLTSEAIIEITNYKSKPIELQIQREITGDLIDSDKEWKVNTGFVQGYFNNKVNYVTWKLTIPAKKTETIKYKYQILID